MSKFIDLADEVGYLIGVPISSIAVAHVEDVLRWLYRHPEKVPGRTITAGEVGQWSHLIRGDVETPSIIDFLEALGIAVVPDHKPTNADELAWALMRVIEKHGRGVTISDQADARAIAELLDADGVKALGGDDE